MGQLCRALHVLGEEKKIKRKNESQAGCVVMDLVSSFLTDYGSVHRCHNEVCVDAVSVDRNVTLRSTDVSVCNKNHAPQSFLTCHVPGLLALSTLM